MASLKDVLDETARKLKEAATKQSSGAEKKQSSFYNDFEQRKRSKNVFTPSAITAKQSVPAQRSYVKVEPAKSKSGFYDDFTQRKQSKNTFLPSTVMARQSAPEQKKYIGVEPAKNKSSFYNDFQSRRKDNNSRNVRTIFPNEKTSGFSFTPSTQKQSGSKRKTSEDFEREYWDELKRTNPTMYYEETEAQKKRSEAERRVSERMKNGPEWTEEAAIRTRHVDDWTRENVPKFLDWLGKSLYDGIAQADKNYADAIDFVISTPKDFGFNDNPIDNGLQWYRNNAQNARRSAHEAGDKLGGAGWNVAGDLLSTTVTAAPQIAVGYATGGMSLGAGAGTGAGLGTGAGALEAAAVNGQSTMPILARQVIGEAMRNPAFYTTFATEAGGLYQDALEKGASREEATVTALAGGFLNGLIEMSGGVETLKQQGNSLKALIDSGLHEGLEEIAQGMTGKSAEKIVYDKDKKLFSLTDEDAIINPGRMAMEGGGGALAGFGYGGVPVAANYINNTVQTGNMINSVGEAQSLIDEGLASREGTAARKYAERMQRKLDRSGQISDWNAGRQVMKNDAAIEAEEQFIDDISDVTGVPAVVRDNIDGYNGQYVSGENERVELNRNGEMNLADTGRHEYTHVFKQHAPEAYTAFENYVFNAAMETNSEAVYNRLGRLKDLYRQKGLEYTDAIGREEIVAELTSPFEPNVRKIAEGNPTLADKIRNGISSAKAAVKSKLGAPYENNRGVQLTYSQLNQAEQLWNNALKETVDNAGGDTAETGDVRYSPIEYDVSGNPFVVINDDILNGITDEKEQRATVRKYILDNFPTIQVNGEEIRVNAGSRGEFTNSKYTRTLERTDKGVYEDKLRSARNLDEIVQARQNIRPETLNHSRKDSITGFEKGDVTFRVGKNYYDASVLVGLWNDGTKVFHDIVDITKNTGVVPRVSSQNANNSGRNQQPVSYNNSISQNNGNVNPRNSIMENTSGEAAAHDAQTPIEHYSEEDDVQNRVKDDAEAYAAEEVRVGEFMQDDTLINAYNSESASRADKKRFGKGDIVPMLKKYGIGFMAREVDKLYPIKSYERFAENQIHGKEKVHFRGKNSPYVMSSNSLDAESRAKYILTEELTNFDGDTIGESLADIVGDLSYDDYKDFNTYLKLRHGVEWITGDKNTDKPVWGSKILNDPAAMKAAIKQFETKHPDYANLAQRVYQYQADLMKAWLVDTGIITQEQYDTLRKKYPDYVPFFRQDDTPPPRFRPQKGIANQGNTIMEAEGGRQRIYDPIENIMINTSRIVNAAAKNSAMHAVVNIHDTVPGMEVYMAEVVKDPETGKFKLKESGATAAENSTEEHAEPEEYITDMVQHAIKLTDGDIVTVLQNGQERYFKVFDSDFLRAIDNMHPIQSGAIMRAVASATRVFSALATNANPAFTLASNPIKDAQNAYVQTTRKNPFGVIWGILDAQVEQVKNSDMGKKVGQKKNPDYDGTDVYKKYMAMGGEYASAFSAGRKAMDEALRDIRPEKKGIKAKAGKVARFIPNMYGTIADAIETGPRLGEFKYSIGKAGNDAHQAHFDSKNVTLNFGRSGYVGEKINKFVPFYNPSVQGISMMVQQFKNHPLKTTLRIAAGMIIPSVISLIFNKRDKESEEAYTNASSYLKNNYYLFHTGGGNFFKMPKSQEYGILPSLTERVVERYAYQNPDAFYNYGDYVSSALLPSLFKAEFPFVDTGSIIGLGTYTSLLENKDFKGSPIVPEYMQDEVPEEQYDDRTSYIARWVGKALGWSPKQIDYSINSNTGFIGSVNKNVFHDGKKDWSFGFGSKFTADSYFSTDKPNMFYENKDAADRKAKSYPAAESIYLSNRYAQASNVLSIINKIYKEDTESEKGRQTRKAYVNYSGWSKDNPMGFSDEVYQEIKGLYDEDKSIFKLPEIDKEIKADKQSYTFRDPYTVMNYQKDLNQAVDSAYRKTISSVEYASAEGKEEKAALLTKAKADAINEVKEFYIDNKGSKQYVTEQIQLTKPTIEEIEDYKAQEAIASVLETEKDRLKEWDESIAIDAETDKVSVWYDDEKYELTDDQAKRLTSEIKQRTDTRSKELINWEKNIEDVLPEHEFQLYADEMTQEQYNNCLAKANDEISRTRKASTYKEKTEARDKFVKGKSTKKVNVSGNYNDWSERVQKAILNKVAREASKEVKSEMEEEIKANGAYYIKPSHARDKSAEPRLGSNQKKSEPADEITGNTSSAADAAASPQEESSSEPVKVSFRGTRFRSTRRSSGRSSRGSARRSSGRGTGGGASGGTRGRGVTVEAATPSRAAREMALDNIIASHGGNPAIRKALRELKIEPVQALKL